jgi:tetratricopeptide (TPR) repeat protein
MRRLATITLILLLPATAAVAQTSWSDRTRAGEWAFSRGDTARAEAEFRAALGLAQGLPAGDRRLETSLQNLARFYEHQMRMDEAQPLYQLLLAAQEERVGEADPLLLDTLLAIARVAIPSGDAPAAEASLQSYLEIAESTGAADPEDRWRALKMLGRIFTIEERHDEALALQRRVVTAMDDDSIATGAERAAELESLAQMEILHGAPDAAEPLLARAVELLDADGPRHAADVWADAAATAFGAGEADLAEGLANTALQSVAVESDTPEAAHRVLADVSWLRVRRGSEDLSSLIEIDGDPEELAEAGARLEAWLAIQEADLPPDHPEVLDTVSRLAQVATMAKELDGAIGWQQRKLASVRETAGSRSQSWRAGTEALIGLYVAAGRTAEAASANADLIAEIEAASGPDDRRLIAPLSRQLELLGELGRKKEAKAIKKRLRKMSR